MARMIPPSAPRAIHRSEKGLPFVALGDGTHLQLLHVDIPAGLWVVRTRFEPGVTIPTHIHTGPVFAVTHSGRWKYKEYPEVNTAGSYLYEPAGSVHTLTVPADQEGLTEVWFAIYGANLNVDENGNVVSVIDAAFIKQVYVATCAANGLPTPDIIEGGAYV
ncbi:MAG: 2,4'-dihydroxyacetophenone dioxygenase family protein [Deltaproteobacteria bacterium]|nr:2,4'-dihydroxyacetophenone dioxygenase family protein [Deltaproteobacteria bacterium]